MPTEVILPRVDMDMTTGKVSRWYVAEAGHVEKGQPLFEIETDKAAMEVEAPATGTLGGIAVDEGVAIPVGTVIAWIYADGEARDTPEPAAAAGATQPLIDGQTAIPANVDGLADPVVPVSEAAPRSSTPDLEGVRATPLARRLAREKGIDIVAIRGSGPRGRVQAADLEAGGEPSGATTAAPLRRVRSVILSGLNAAWLREGMGSPLILIHGYGADLNAWRPLLAVAQLGRPVLGIDLPGHGLSDIAGVDSFDDLCAAVERALAAAGIDRVHLAGHSLGAAVAARIATRGGNAVRSLMLIAPAGLGPEINSAFIDGLARARSEDSLRPWLRELVADEAALGPAFVRETASQRADGRLRAQQAEIAKAVFPDGTQVFSIRPDLARLTIPTKVVFGALDRIIPARQVRGLPGVVARHLFAGVGHMPHLEVKQEVARLLNELILAAGQP